RAGGAPRPAGVAGIDASGLAQRLGRAAAGRGHRGRHPDPAAAPLAATAGRPRAEPRARRAPGPDRRLRLPRRHRALLRGRGEADVTRGTWLALSLFVVLAGCTSPEATRARAQSQGADVRNVGSVVK